jgi:RNA polymerase sigma-70 factor (ECF subfamily)
LGDDQRDLIAAMARVAAGDRAAFRTLYARTAPKLFASIRRILRSEAAAEDALQEAYVRVWRHAGDFDPAIASPVAWMTTIARHAAIDAARRGAERISAASDDIDADFSERMAAPAPGGDPLAAGRLATCLEKLEADKRTMVVLAYCHGWSRDELAERYARPAATVKTVLRRSLLVLKECLGGRD